MNIVKMRKDLRLLTEKEVSEMTGLSHNTLKSDRARKKGLPFVKLGYSVRYRLSDIEKYIEQNTIDPEDDYRTA